MHFLVHLICCSNSNKYGRLKHIVKNLKNSGGIFNQSRLIQSYYFIVSSRCAIKERQIRELWYFFEKHKSHWGPSTSSRPRPSSTFINCSRLSGNFKSDWFLMDDLLQYCSDAKKLDVFFVLLISTQQFILGFPYDRCGFN